MKELVLRIVSASLLMAVTEALIPSGNMGKCVKRAFALIFTMMIAESLIGLLNRGVL